MWAPQLRPLEAEFAKSVGAAGASHWFRTVAYSSRNKEDVRGVLDLWENQYRKSLAESLTVRQWRFRCVDEHVNESYSDALYGDALYLYFPYASHTVRLVYTTLIIVSD